MAKYIQYFCTNDFSFGGVTGLPSAVSGGGVRSWGLGAFSRQSSEHDESRESQQATQTGRGGQGETHNGGNVGPRTTTVAFAMREPSSAASVRRALREPAHAPSGGTGPTK